MDILKMCLLLCVVKSSGAGPGAAGAGARAFPDAATRLLRRVRLPPATLARLRPLLTDLRHALATRWTEVEVTPFGSIMTGLGIVGSDVDCFAQLPEPDRISLVFEIKDALDRFPHTFHEIRTIQSSVAPIVKFTHAPTGLQCDVSFRTLAGVRKTALTKYYVQLDDRVRDLATIVKYWAKRHKPATSKRIMSSFALVSLVVFYLQRVDMVPPVAALQENAKQDIIEQWNTGFDEILVPHTRAMNVSLFELLGGFFKFYHEFDFDNFIVSTFAGVPIKRSDFENVSTVPELFEVYKRNVASGSKPLNIRRPVVLQDPFIHNYNIAAETKKEVLAQLKSDLKFAVQAYVEGRDDFLQVILEESEVLSPGAQCVHSWTNATIQSCSTICSERCCF